MTRADDIRRYALNEVRLARRRRGRGVVFTAGDVREGMGLPNGVEVEICGAIGTQKFLEMANVDMWIRPPLGTASTEFHCEILR